MVQGQYSNNTTVVMYMYCTEVHVKSSTSTPSESWPRLIIHIPIGRLLTLLSASSNLEVFRTKESE